MQQLIICFKLAKGVRTNTIVLGELEGKIMANSKSSWIWRLLGGIILVILGILILVYPKPTLAIAVLLVGIFLIIAGVFELIFGFSAEAKSAKWLFILQGIISLILGILIVVYPAITLAIFIYLLAAWAIIWGVFELIATFMVPEEVRQQVYGTGGKMLGIVIGLIAIVLGIVLAVYPEATLTIIIYLFGFLVVAIGALMAINSFGTRKTKA
jgi:uncharacterized membrane protein HdeD (DUF308 family)